MIEINEHKVESSSHVHVLLVPVEIPVSEPSVEPVRFVSEEFLEIRVLDRIRIKEKFG